MIWNARPRSAAYRSTAATDRSSPSAMIAPAAAAARMSAPVFFACIDWRPLASSATRSPLARQQRKRLGMQAIAGEDGDAVAVDDVERWPAAAQRVVVHRGEIVV